MTYKFFDKKSFANRKKTGTGVNSEDQQFAEGLQNPIIKKKFKNFKYVYPLKAIFSFC